MELLRDTFNLESSIIMSASVLRAMQKAEAADNADFVTVASAVAKKATDMANIVTESSSSQFYVIAAVAGDFIFAYGLYFFIFAIVIMLLFCKVNYLFL